MDDGKLERSWKYFEAAWQTGCRCCIYQHDPLEWTPRLGPNHKQRLVGAGWCGHVNTVFQLGWQRQQISVTECQCALGLLHLYLWTLHCKDNLDAAAHLGKSRWVTEPVQICLCKKWWEELRMFTLEKQRLRVGMLSFSKQTKGCPLNETLGLLWWPQTYGGTWQGARRQAPHNEDHSVQSWSELPRG